MTIRVLIADDQHMVRAGFSMILNSADDIDVISEVDNGQDAVTKALHLRPDVCLFDIRMPQLDGIEATRQIAGHGVVDPLNVVIITTFDLDEYVFGALEAGATGFLLKNAGPELLLTAIRAAYLGDALISPEITRRLLDHLLPARSRQQATALVELTDRETQTLEAVSLGLTNKEISDRLHISVSTVKAHIAKLMAKVHARNRVELVIWAYQHGFRPGTETS